MRKTSLVLISLVAFSLARAGLSETLFNGPQDCPNLNLEDPGGPLENVPTFDQAQGDVCFALAGATVATALIRNAGNAAKGGSSWAKTDVVSPSDTVFQEVVYTQKANSKASYINVCKGDGSNLADCSEWFNGDLCDSLNGLRDSGACKLSSTEHLTQSGNQFDRAFFDHLRPSLHLLWKARLDTWSTNRELKKLHQLIGRSGCVQPDQLNVRLLELDRELRKIATSTAESQVYKDMRALRALFNPVCEPREPLPAGFQCQKHDRDVYEDAEKKEMISKAFSHGMQSLPIGIGYCSNLLVHSGTVGLHKKENRVIAQTVNCKGHFSILVGQRWNPKPKAGSPRCEYLIRNTWGPSCDPYSSDWECVPGKGDLWVDADQLLKNTDSLDTL